MEFWIFVLAITLALSFLLATRSMKGAKPKVNPADQALFLIRNSHLLGPEILTKLYDLSLAQNFTFSLERLFKGAEVALVIFGPKSLESSLPELGLLELEDYLLPKDHPGSVESSKISANHALGWEVAVEKSTGIEDHFLKQLNLQDQEQFFYQLVCLPLKSKQEGVKQFKVTTRAMAVEKNPTSKVRLAKKIFTQINSDLGIGDRADLRSQPAFFTDFGSRLIGEGGKNNFTPAQVVRLLGY